MQGFVEISMRYRLVANCSCEWRFIVLFVELFRRLLKVSLNDELWWRVGELFCWMVNLYGEAARSGALYMQSVQNSFAHRTLGIYPTLARRNEKIEVFPLSINTPLIYLKMPKFFESEVHFFPKKSLAHKKCSQSGNSLVQAQGCPF